MRRLTTTTEQPESVAAWTRGAAAPAGRVIAQVCALPAGAWVAALTLLGLALRAYHLGAESFWFDEADIVRQAQQPLGTLLVGFTKAGENGPLYTLLLHGWVALVGTNEAAVRALALAAGAATIPLMYEAGRRLADREVGLLAAGLLAVSPFHIWYSQDAKMYALVVLLTLGSTLLYARALETGAGRIWLGYVVVTWAALAVHSLAVLILLAQLLATPFLWPRAGRAAPSSGGAGHARRRRWAAALGVLLLPFLPIAYERGAALLAGNVQSTWYPAAALGDILGTLAVKFALNRADEPWQAIGSVLGGALFLAGLWPWARAARRAWAVVALLVLAPVALFWLLTLVIPLFEPRYLILVLPFYLLLVAVGIGRIAGRAPWAAGTALLALLALQGAALLQYNYSPDPQKEEWRQALAYVRDHMRLRDVIIVDPGYLETAVQLYDPPAPGVPTVPVAAVPDLNTAHFGARELADWLDRAVTNHERAWLILSPPRTSKDDPAGAVQHYLEGNWRTFDVQEFIGVKVYGYAFNGQPHSWWPKPTHPQGATFPGGFHFRGYIYEVRSGVPDQTSNAGWLPLTLYWSFDAAPRPAQDYIIAVRLLDAHGKEWAAYDQAPLNGYRPTPTFPPSVWMIDYPDLFIPGNAPPGLYHVTVQVWPRCPPAGPCWDAAHPRVHAGRPLAVVEASAGAVPGATTLTLDQPLTVTAWRPR